MNWQIGSIMRTDLARFFVWTGDGFARDALCADHPNLQKRCTIIRFWGGFSGSQWLCCSGLGATVQHSGQNVPTFRVIYHLVRIQMVVIAVNVRRNSLQ